MAVCMCRIANQRKVSKWLPFKSYKSESLNIRCVYEGHSCICVPSMKFVHLTLWLGKVCAGNNANADANDNDT